MDKGDKNYQDLASKILYLKTTNPKKYREYMQRLSESNTTEAKTVLREIVEKAARDRTGYESLQKAVSLVPLAPIIPYSKGIKQLWKALNHPATQTIGTVSGIHNLFTNKGVSKTVDHFEKGENLKGALSATGDLLDASPMIGAFKSAKYIANAIKSGENARRALSQAWKHTDIGRWFSPENRSYHAYNTIPPFGYNDPIKRGKSFVKSWMLDKQYSKDPVWNDAEKLIPAIKYDIPESKKLDLILAGRTDAYRLYSRMPQKYGVYIQNTDGTYRYNLEKLSKLSGVKKENLIIPFSEVGKHDYLTSAHAHLWEVSDEFIDDAGSGVQKIIDMWDVNPFSRSGGGIGDIVRKNIYNPINLKLKTVEDKVRQFGLNHSIDDAKFREWLSNPQNNFYFDAGMVDPEDVAPRMDLVGKIAEKISKYRAPNIKLGVDKLNSMFKNFELGSITGQKPFMLKMEIPFEVIENGGDKIYRAKNIE